MQLFPRGSTAGRPLEFEGFLTQESAHRIIISTRIGHLLVQNLADKTRNAHVLLCRLNTDPGSGAFIHGNGDVLHRALGMVRPVAANNSASFVYLDPEPILEPVDG